MNNLLLALQLCPVDADAAVELAKLIVDIEKVSPATCRPQWLISYRRDTPLSRVSAIEQSLCKHFDTVWLAKAKHFANGWPAGSNALWRSTMDDAANIARGSDLSPVAGVLTFEPDCVPLTLDWIDRLDHAYATRKFPVLGNIHQSETEAAHVNGNAIFPVFTARDWPELMSTPAEYAWDYFHREFLLRRTEDTPLITQYYRRKNLSVGEFSSILKNGIRPVLLHGIKDASARLHVRGELLREGQTARSVGRSIPVQGATEALRKGALQSPMQP